MVGDPSRLSSPPGASEASPDAPGPRRVLLGELLVESKVITPEQLSEVLASPRETGKKLGQVLLERGWITEAQLTQTLSLQLSVPWVSLYHIDFSRQLLNRLSREVAERYCLIPIFVRHVKGQGETLYVAMDDPTNVAALQEVAHLAGLPTRPMIASASDIRSAIRVYYGETSPGASVLDVPVPTTRQEPPTTTRQGRPAPPREPPPAPPVAPAGAAPPPVPNAVRPSLPGAAPAGAAPAAKDDAPPTARSFPPGTGPATPERPRQPLKTDDEEVERKPRRPSRPDEGGPERRRPRALNLTLLDGTTITLPAKNREPESEGLTAHDFINALRAASEGSAPSGIVGDQVRWEPVVAALLSLLLRKGLIADWEFIEELQKR